MNLKSERIPALRAPDVMRWPISRIYRANLQAACLKVGLPTIIRTKEILWSDVRWEKHLYCRDITNEKLFLSVDELEKKYKKTEFDPIVVNKENILVDGLRRWLALSALNDNKTDFMITVAEIDTGDDPLQILHYSVAYNSKHGRQLTGEEKKNSAKKLYPKISKIKLAESYGVCERTMHGWLTEERTAETKETLDEIKKIQEKYKKEKKRLTHQKISDHLKSKGIDKSRSTVRRILKDMKNPVQSGKSSKMNKKFTPYTTVYWHPKMTKEENKEWIDDEKLNKFYGKANPIYMVNLFHYHTKPNDMIVDFTGGSGTSLRVAEKMEPKRHCVLYDLNPKQSLLQRNLITQWDLGNGLPHNLPERIHMVFLDTPYSQQAKKKYSASNPKDLANMSLDDFYKTLEFFFGELRKLRFETLAFMINPSNQDENNNIAYHDHALKFHEMLYEDFEIINKYHLFAPSAFQNILIKKADPIPFCINNMRDLHVYKKKHR